LCSLLLSGGVLFASRPTGFRVLVDADRCVWVRDRRRIPATLWWLGRDPGALLGLCLSYPNECGTGVHQEDEQRPDILDLVLSECPCRCAVAYLASFDGCNLARSYPVNAGGTWISRSASGVRRFGMPFLV